MNQTQSLDSSVNLLISPSSLGRRTFLKGLAAATLMSGCATAGLGSPPEVTGHFRGDVGEYRQEAERALEDLTGFLGHPFYGVIKINVGSFDRPFTYRGIPPIVNMPYSYIQSNTDQIIHELVRAVTVSFDTILNRGLAVVSQRTLRPDKRTFPFYAPVNVPYIIDPNQYISDGSFVGYLIGKYGMEKLMDFTSMAYLSDSFVLRFSNIDLNFITFPKADIIVFGKSMEELIKEWQEKVQGNPNVKPFDIRPTPPQRKFYNEEVTRRHRGRVVAVGNDSISKSGLELVRNDAAEAYGVLSGVFGKDLPGIITIDLTTTKLGRVGIPYLRLDKDNTYIQPEIRTALRGDYPLVMYMAFPFIGKERNLAAIMAAAYLQMTHTKLGSLKVRTVPNYGVDVDRLAKANINDLKPHHRLPLDGGPDVWRDNVLPLIQAGSFSNWVVNEYAQGNHKKGVDMLVRVARGASYESVFGASLDAMERQWLGYLNRNVRL